MAIRCNNEVIPFNLFFEDAFGEKYFVNELWNSKSQLSHENIPVLKENARIAIQFHSEVEEENKGGSVFVRLETSRFQDIEEQPIEIIKLGKTMLFEGKRGEIFPFRMGIYLFEMHINSKVYYGGIKVVPLHIKINQVLEMHQFLDEQVKGLIYDFVYTKKTLGKKEEVDLPHYWYYDYARRMEDCYIDIINSLEKIIKQPRDQIINSYKISKYQQRIDRNSIQWSISGKGIAKNNGSTPPLYHYNKQKVSDLSIKENRWIKNILLLWLNDISNVIYEINKDKKVIQHKRELLMIEIEELEAKKKKYLNDWNVGENTKRDIKSRSIMARQDLLKARNQDVILKRWLECLASIENKLTFYIYHSFLVDIERSYKRTILKDYNYLTLESIYQNLKLLMQDEGREEKLTPILKPTWQIYEYYCLFKVIDIIKRQGFEMVSGLEINILDSYFEGKIPDGTKFILEKDNQLVHVWFDHYHANTASEADKKGEAFYNFNPKKKPDIKVDVYNKLKDKLWHIGTIIFDSKFRKLNDLYSSTYNSSTQEQLMSYFSFFYTGEGEHKNRSCVEKVICMYAGDGVKDVVTIRDPIIFLKFFPDMNDEVASTTGEIELENILIEVIEGKTDL